MKNLRPICLSAAILISAAGDSLCAPQQPNRNSGRQSGAKTVQEVEAKDRLLITTEEGAVREMLVPIAAKELVVDGLGTLILGGDQSLLTSVVVNEGTLVLAANRPLGGSCVIRPSYGVTVGFNYPPGGADLKMFNAERAPAFTLALNCNSNEDLDFGSYPALAGASLGAIGQASYGGTITPHDSVYRLGGGGGILRLLRSLDPAATVIVGGFSAPYGKKVYWGDNPPHDAPRPQGTVVLPASSQVPAALVIQNGLLKIGEKRVPSTPVSLSLERLSTESVKLTWLAADTACAVEMESEGKPFAEKLRVPEGRNFCVIDGLPKNQKLQFRVFGMADGLRSSASNVASVDTAPEALPSPELLVAHGAYKWVDLEWKNNPSAQGTLIQQSADGTIFSDAKTIPPGTTRGYVYVPGTKKVSFRVAGLDADSKPGPWSNTLVAETNAGADIEKDILHRFQLDDGSRDFSPNNPSVHPTYSEGEKTTQRQRGRELVADFAAKIASGTTYQIPKGVYRVSAGALCLSGLQEVVVKADGVTFILEGKTDKPDGPLFQIAQCKNLRIEGPMVLTTDVPKYSVARIVASDAAAKTVDLEVLPGYSINPADKGEWYSFDNQGRMLSENRYSGSKKIGDRQLQLLNAMWDGEAPFAAVPAGDVPSFGAFGIGRGEKINENLTFQDVTCYGFGAPAGGVKGYVRYLNYRVLPQPGTSQLFCFWPGQFGFRQSALIFDGCEFNTGGDDGINLMGASGLASAQTGPRSVTVFRLKPEKGELLRFYEYRTLKLLGEARVESVETMTAPHLLADGNHWLATNRTGRNDFKEAQRVTLDRDVRIGWYAQTYAPESGASELVVRNCYWRDMFAQAILAQTFRQGLIADNLFLGSTQQAVELSASAYWQEGYWPNHAAVRNNVIRNNPSKPNRFISPSIAVGISPKIPGSVTGLIENCAVEGNRIYGSGYSAIGLHYGKNCQVLRNTIINPGRFKDPNSAAIELTGGENVEISENLIQFGDSGCRKWIRFGKDVRDENIRLSGNRILDADGREIHATQGDGLTKTSAEPVR